MRPVLALTPLPLLVAAVALAQGPPTYHYTAETQSTARRQGMVVVGALTWTCQGSRCSISGPWAVPGLSACQALAQLVGPIKSYGHPGKQLSAAELAKCNEGLSKPGAGSKAPVGQPATGGGSGAVTRPSGGVSVGTGGLKPLGGAAAAGVPNAAARSLRSERYAELSRRIREEQERARRHAEALRNRSQRGTDCDDRRADVHPGASEVCDHADNDCDGTVDEGQTLPRYLDADGDGHGDPARRLDACPSDISATAAAAEGTGAGWLVEVGNDCDDADPTRWRDCGR